MNRPQSNNNSKTIPSQFVLIQDKNEGVKLSVHKNHQHQNDGPSDSSFFVSPKLPRIYHSVSEGDVDSDAPSTSLREIDDHDVAFDRDFRDHPLLWDSTTDLSPHARNWEQLIEFLDIKKGDTILTSDIVEAIGRESFCQRESTTEGTTQCDINNNSLFDSRSSFDCDHDDCPCDLSLNRTESFGNGNGFGTQQLTEDSFHMIKQDVAKRAAGRPSTPRYTNTTNINDSQHSTASSGSKFPPLDDSLSSLRLKAVADKSHASLNQLSSSPGACLLPARDRSTTKSSALTTASSHHISSIPRIDEDNRDQQFPLDFCSTASLPCEFLDRSSGSSSSLFDGDESALSVTSASSIQRRVTIRNEPEILLFSGEDRPRDICRRITMKRRIRWRLREWRQAFVRGLHLTDEGEGDHHHRVANTSSEQLESSSTSSSTDGLQHHRSLSRLFFDNPADASSNNKGERQLGRHSALALSLG